MVENLLATKTSTIKIKISKKPLFQFLGAMSRSFPVLQISMSHLTINKFIQKEIVGTKVGLLDEGCLPVQNQFRIGSYSQCFSTMGISKLFIDKDQEDAIMLLSIFTIHFLEKDSG
ncbi:MAG: hypothetical protein ACYTFW_23600 [Planctomycetota bacterium]